MLISIQLMIFVSHVVLLVRINSKVPVIGTAAPTPAPQKLASAVALVTDDFAPAPTP